MNKKLLNKLLFFLQPLLIALYPMFFLYSHSVGEAYFYDFILLFGCIFIFTILFYFVLSFIFKSNLKACIFITFFYLGSFVLPIIYSKVDEVIFWGIRFFKLRYFLLIFLIFLIFLFFKLLRIKNIRNIWGKFLIVPYFLLIIFSVFNIFISLNQINKLIDGYKKENKQFLLKNNQNLKYSKKIDYLPDIYFIILDRYPSGRALNQFFDYDNSQFLNKLRDFGFYITNDSNSNYPFTVRSIPSTMNINYNSYLKTNDKSHALAHYMMNNNNIMHYLKQFEYRFYNINSFWGPARNLSHSYFKPKYKIPNYFISNYLSMTIFSLISRYFYEKLKYTFILKQLDSLINLKNIDGPKFIFAHIHSPHSPFVFDKYGKFTTLKWQNDYKAYLEQLTFINYKVINVVQELLDSYDNKPIVILQSDHGGKNLGPYISRDRSKLEDLLFGYGILSAFYLPEIKKNELLKDISPINNFRFIFNKYFGTDFEILENKQF